MQVDEEEEPYEEEDGEGSLIDEDEEYQVQRGANALGRKNQKGVSVTFPRHRYQTRSKNHRNRP